MRGLLAKRNGVCRLSQSALSGLAFVRSAPNRKGNKMKKSVRKAVIAGNWKMNKTPAQTLELVNELVSMVQDKNGCDIVICPPFVDLANALSAVKGTNIKVGAQNVHFEPSGAYTGEISVDMLCEMGVAYVIIGHSERRQYFGETDMTVNKRIKAALAGGLTVILCVGECWRKESRALPMKLSPCRQK